MVRWKSTSPESLAADLCCSARAGGIAACERRRSGDCSITRLWTGHPRTAFSSSLPTICSPRELSGPPGDKLPRRVRLPKVLCACGCAYYALRMATLTVRTDDQTDRALRELTADGTSQSEVIRRAIYQAWRERQYARMEEESKRLLADPEEQQEIRAIRADMDAVGAW